MSRGGRWALTDCSILGSTGDGGDLSKCKLTCCNLPHVRAMSSASDSTVGTLKTLTVARANQGLCQRPQTYHDHHPWGQLDKRFAIFLIYTVLGASIIRLREIRKLFGFKLDIARSHTHIIHIEQNLAMLTNKPSELSTRGNGGFSLGGSTSAQSNRVHA